MELVSLRIWERSLSWHPVFVRGTKTSLAEALSVISQQSAAIYEVAGRPNRGMHTTMSNGEDLSVSTGLSNPAKRVLFSPNMFETAGGSP